ncbi:MAG: flagellar M-ring protein FliF C-terminal domain-containing protein, partial [Thiobacillus sp.]
EVDKTIQYVQQAGGGLKRLSVGVVVNYRRTVDKSGKVVMKPLSEAEKAQITNLVKEAMGYNQARGDTVNVVNSPFASAQAEDLPEPPFWKQPEYAEYFAIARTVGKYLLMSLALLLLYLKVAKPLLRKMSEQQALPAPGQALHLEQLAGDERPMLPGQRNYQENLSRAQKLASEDPRVVANIVKTWVANND